MPRRRVTLSDAFLAKARQLFPAERSVQGRPSFVDFEEGPLRAAVAALSLNFDAQRELEPGTTSVRYVIIPPHGAFQPLVFFACLVASDAVELSSLIEDHDYWDVVGHDPIE